MAWTFRRDDAGRSGAPVGGRAGAALASVGASALLACGVLGERADTDMCPTGETCSSATPNGLRFLGPTFEGTYDNALRAVAVGGTQTLYFSDASYRAQPLPAHRVVSSQPLVIELSASDTGGTVARGLAQGDAWIRVIDAEDRLLDRISMGSEVLAAVRLAAPPFVPTVRPFGFAAGTHRMSVALLGASGHRLVDEGLVFGDTSAIYTRFSWDTVDVDVPATTGARLEVTTAGRRFALEVPIAGPVDEITVSAFPIGAENLDPLRVRDGGSLCFDLVSAGATVVGSDAMFSYRIDGLPAPPAMPDRCVSLRTGLGASVLVEVTAAGITREFTAIVDHETGSMSLVDTSAAPLPQWGSLGERAFLVRGLDVPWLAPRGI